MSKSDLYDEEVVADSEEEDIYLPQGQPSPVPATQFTSDNSASLIQTPAFPAIPRTGLLPLQPTDTSNVSYFTDKQPQELGTSIGTFTIRTDVSCSSGKPEVNNSNPNSNSSSVPKGRPKPRPAFRIKDNPGAVDKSSNKQPSPGPKVSNKTPSSNYYPDIQMATSLSTPNIAERAKMHSRARTKPTATDPISSIVVSTNPKQHTKNVPVLSDEVIELSSDDDELALRSPPKTKTKTRPKSKPKPNAPHSDDLKATPKPKPVKRSRTSHHPTPPDSTSRASTPEPTSPIPTPFRFPPSQLPPSDPPPSTSTTTEFDHPPIAVLPDPDTSFDLDMRSSSPLFSPPKGRLAARKRKLPQPRGEFDWGDGVGVGMGMDIDVESDMQRMPPPPIPAPLPPPPPTFFASSSPTASSGDDPQVEVEVVDLSTSTSSTSTNASTKKASKAKAPKKPRKNKGDVVSASGEAEHRDGETEVIPKTKNGRGKGKRGTAARDQIEAVIEAPAVKGKSKSKGKEKEVFKSREFIEDGDDDEPGEVSVVGLNKVKESTVVPKPISSVSMSSILDSEVEVPGKKRRMTVGEDEESVDSPKKKRKRNGNASGKDNRGGKTQKAMKVKDKGKAVILSEDEADDDSVASDEGGVMVSRGGKSGIGKSDKGDDKAGKKDTLEEGSGGTPGVGESVDHNGANNDGGGSENCTKENIRPESSVKPTIDACTTPKESFFPKLSSRYTIAPRTKSTPMSELIRRVNSLPGSPFSTPHPRASTSKLQSTPNGTAYSPYLKSSRSLLSRIAPLHPNRRTPPPPLPPPPPPKKTKKEKEREETWEEELVESVGGVSEWACLTDAERKEMRKIKWEKEMGGWDD